LLASLTRRQREIYDYLVAHRAEFDHPPTLDELCAALGLTSRGSLHKQIQALVEGGLVAPMNHQRRGIRLAEAASPDSDQEEPPEPEEDSLPLLGVIAAGRPIEAISGESRVRVPPLLRTKHPCYVLRVKGDSMRDAGILDGDHVVVEQRETARNGEIVVALIDGAEATLKRIEQRSGEVLLHAENPAFPAQRYAPDRVLIQGVLVGQMRRY